MVVRNRGAQASSSPAASIFARQIGGSAGLIDENEFQRIEVGLPGEPFRRCCRTSARCCSSACAVFFLTVICDDRRSATARAKKRLSGAILAREYRTSVQKSHRM